MRLLRLQGDIAFGQSIDRMFVRKITLSQKLRYLIDNSLSGGTASLIGWLGVVTLLIILMASSLLVINNWQPANDNAAPASNSIVLPETDALSATPTTEPAIPSEPNATEAGGYSFAEAAWQSLMRSLDAGMIGGDAADDNGNGWAFRLWGLVITLAGLFIVGSLISILSAAWKTNWTSCVKAILWYLSKKTTH